MTMLLDDPAALRALSDRMRADLTDDILPFWTRHGLDRDYGGMLTALGRRGEVLDDDKSVWFQGRSAWTYAAACLELGTRDEWLAAAESCVSFIERHCFDRDGRMFFRVARDGRPVVKRKRYIFSETFAVVGMAAYARASGRQEYASKAAALFERALTNLRAPGVLEPKFDPSTRASDGLAVHMILIATAQELRLASPPAEADRLTALIDGEAAIIRERFMKPELRALLEQVGPGGEFQSGHIEGRMLNPGHAIEAAWFLLRESRERGGDAALKADALAILDWMWDWGWDKEYGGIIYFRDVLGLPGVEYWHDMKFWWPQNEAVIATMMAYAETGEGKWGRRFEDTWDWSQARFPDREFGEWYGYLHRDGTPSTELKGTMYKGPFHVPRMYLWGLKLADELLARGPAT